MTGRGSTVRTTGPTPDRRRLAETLRTGPFEQALREAIRLSGLTLERLRHRLAQRGVRVSVSALSYWQRGGNRPERPESIRALGVLEDVLGLPPNALVGLLGPRRPRGPRQARRQTTRTRALSTILAAVDVADPADASAGLSWQWIHEQCVFDGSGRLTRSRNIRVVKADDVRVTRAVLVFQMAEAAVDLRCRRGARVGRSGRDDESGFAVFELVLDHPLDPGSTLPIEFDLDFGTGDSEPLVERTFQSPVPGYLLELQFDPAALPTRCEAFYQSDPDGGPRALGELTLDARHRVHLLTQSCPVGVHGVRWEWT